MDGAEAGLVMPPTPAGRRRLPAGARARAWPRTRATVLALDERASASPYGVLRRRPADRGDAHRSSPGVVEHEYYAEGIGLVSSRPSRASTGRRAGRAHQRLTLGRRVTSGGRHLGAAVLALFGRGCPAAAGAGSWRRCGCWAAAGPLAGLLLGRRRRPATAAGGGLAAASGCWPGRLPPGCWTRRRSATAAAAGSTAAGTASGARVPRACGRGPRPKLKPGARRPARGRGRTAAGRRGRPAAPPSSGARMKSHSWMIASVPANSPTPIERAGFTDVPVAPIGAKWIERQGQADRQRGQRRVLVAARR